MLDQVEQEGNPGGEFAGGALESWIASFVRGAGAGRVEDAPVDQFRLAGNSGQASLTRSQRLTT